MDVNADSEESPQATEPAKPDAGDIDRAGLLLRPLAALAAPSEFAVVVQHSTWTKMLEHAQTRLDVEVGGVLIGKAHRAENGTPYLLIDSIIPAVAAESRTTNITFTADAWTRIHETIDRDHPGGTIVGWYHTHPAFGIFLSEMDVFICRHFFDLPHQVAIVIDPVAKTHGCFVWCAGVPTQSTMLIEGGEIDWIASPATNVETQVAHKSNMPTPARRSTLGDMCRAIWRFGFARWLTLLLLLLVAAGLFGALAMVVFHIPPHTVVERLRSLFSHSIVNGGTRL